MEKNTHSESLSAESPLPLPLSLDFFQLSAIARKSAQLLELLLGERRGVLAGADEGVVSEAATAAEAGGALSASTRLRGACSAAPATDLEAGAGGGEEPGGYAGPTFAECARRAPAGAALSGHTSNKHAPRHDMLP